jgi:diguanylate cyclase (GGDEF)-like protein
MPSLSAHSPRSFRVQSAVWHGALVIALAIALPLVFGVMHWVQIRHDEGLALHVVAQNVARTLAAGLDDRSREVEALAADTDLWAAGLGSDAVKRALARANAATPHSSWIGAAARDGTVLAASAGILEGESVAARPWFKEGFKATHVGDVHPAVLLSKLLPPAPSGEPLRFVDFASPILLGGEVVGVLGKHGSWEWARSVITLMAPENAGELKLEVFIFDRAGHAIYAPRGTALDSVHLPTWPADIRPSRTEVDAGADSLGAVGTWSDGADYLTAIARMQPLRTSSDLGWTVVVREPTAVAFAGARRAVWTVLLIGLAGASLAAGLAWFVSGRLSRPLSDIARAARDVAGGVAGAGIRIDARNSELAHLSTALSDMTRKLVAGNEELERRVQERTAELHLANAELESLARHDPLTGLMNRRAFDERIDMALASANRSGAPLSLLMVDIDHFKRVNDLHGHEAGDDVLQSLAVLLQARVRETDTVARMGGEEFAVLLPETDAAGAMRVAEELVQRAATTEMPAVGQVTISVGVATSLYATDARTLLMRHADKALYAAKHAGRNRVHQADMPPPASLAGLASHTVHANGSHKPSGSRENDVSGTFEPVP